MGTRDKAAAYEGEDILRLFEEIAGDPESMKDSDELTKGRIRTIYTQLKYGSKSVGNIADYYGLPVEFIRDIKIGKAFRSITRDLDDM